MMLRDGWFPVGSKLDPETATRLIWIMAALSFLLAIVSGIGEWLGWWNLVGEIGMTVGGAGGLVLTAFGILSTSSRDQVQGVHETVRDNGRTLASMDDKLDELDKLDKLDDLDVIRDALMMEDGEASKLDIVQFELDRQTGVLDRQLGVLGEIRDGLAAED